MYQQPQQAYYQQQPAYAVAGQQPPGYVQTAGAGGMVAAIPHVATSMPVYAAAPAYLTYGATASAPVVYAVPAATETKAAEPQPVFTASNVNRSMEAHAMLKQKGYRVSSYGAGTKIRIPGETAYKPNVYDFGAATTYDSMYNDLKKKNAARYTKNGMLNMLDRDRKVKERPQRWQDEKEHFDLIITYEQRVYETVCADIEGRGGGDMRPVHVINLDTTDSHAEAATGATQTADLVARLYKSVDWENEISEILDKYEEEHDKPMLHTVLFY